MNDLQLIEKSLFIDILQVSSHGKSILSFIILLLVLIDNTTKFSSLQVFLPFQSVVRKNNDYQLKKTVSWFHNRHSSYESSSSSSLQYESSNHQVMSEVSDVSMMNESPPSEKKSSQLDIKSPQQETKPPQPETKPPQREVLSSQSETKPPQSEIKSPPEVQSSQSEIKPLQQETKPQPETKPPQPGTKSKTKRVTSKMKFDNSVRIIEILRGEEYSFNRYVICRLQSHIGTLGILTHLPYEHYPAIRLYTNSNVLIRFVDILFTISVIT